MEPTLLGGAQQKHVGNGHKL